MFMCLAHCSANSSKVASFSGVLSGVGVGPGQTALQRMPSATAVFMGSGVAADLLFRKDNDA